MTKYTVGEVFTLLAVNKDLAEFEERRYELRSRQSKK